MSKSYLPTKSKWSRYNGEINYVNLPALETMPTASGFSARRRGASCRSVCKIHEDGERRRQQSRKFNREGYRYSLTGTLTHQDAKKIKYILLDLDGVLRVDWTTYVDKSEKLLLIQENIEALRKLIQYYPVAICTSQSGIGRGYYDEKFFLESADLLCQAVSKSLPFFYCPHTPDDACDCRKPKPGLLNAAREHFGNIDPSECIMIGDGKRDSEAGINAGCSSVVLLHPVKMEKDDISYRQLSKEKIEKDLLDLKRAAAEKGDKTKVFYCPSLADFVKHFIQ